MSLLVNLRTQVKKMFQETILKLACLILHGGNKGDCLHAPWSFPHRVPFTKEKLPWCPRSFKNKAYRHELVTVKLPSFYNNQIYPCNKMVCLNIFKMLIGNCTRVPTIIRQLKELPSCPMVIVLVPFKMYNTYFYCLKEVPFY